MGRHTPETELCYDGGEKAAVGFRTVDVDTQAKALRLRMYVLCSECARLIDLAEGNQQKRDVKGLIPSGTLLRSTRLGWTVLGIDDA